MLWNVAHRSYFPFKFSYCVKYCNQFNSLRLNLSKGAFNNNQLFNNIIKNFLDCCKQTAGNGANKRSLGKCIAVISLTSGGVASMKAFTGLKIAKCEKGNDKKLLQQVVATEPKFDWYKFYKFLIPDLWILIIATGCAILAAVLNVQIPIHIGNLVNIMTKFIKLKDDLKFSLDMKRPALLLIGLYTLQSVATFVYISLLSCVGERVAARMKCALFSSIVEQDLAFFDRKRTGELIDCLSTDVQEFKSAFKLCISQGLRSFTQIGGCVVSMYIVSPTMTTIMVVLVPSVVLVGTLFGSILRSMSRAAQQQAAAAINHGEEVISNIRTVRAFANEDKEKEMFEAEVAESRELYERLGFGIGLFQAGTNLFLNVIVLGTLYGGGYLIASSRMTAGDLMSFLVNTQTIQRSVANLSLLFGSFIKGIYAGTRVFQLINQEPDIPLHGGKIIPYHCFIPEVVFRNVTFAYPTRPEQLILNKFNLTIPAGKTVAIVGSSGNGKTTVTMLLERFYDVNFGSIMIGNVDIRELDPNWLRGRVIGIINQEPILFATTVMENIRYGKMDATNEEVYTAAKLANADEFISKFPEGYKTVMGERGVTVSGGQKQRIAIARALLKNPQILILDEATSALDTESEKLVQHALDEVTKNRTVLVIAHRLSTVKNADMIVVLNNGIVVEMGKHDELLKKRGYYWNLMNQQSVDNREFG